MNRLTARQRRNLGESLSGYSFILPQMLGFILFVLMPLLNVFIYSFQNKNMLFGTSTFCGWDNYEKLFSDPLFALTLKNTLIFSVFLVPLNLILAMAMALYLGDGRFGTRYIRTIIFLPVVTSGVAWAIVWKYLLQGGTAGPVNWFLALFGIQGPNWLNEKGWAMASVIVTRVLKNLGTNVLIFYGAVMNLDSSIVEAARIDGASGFKLFSKIKLPLLMPTVLMASIVSMIGSMRVFDTIKLMTEGGPEGSTMVLVYYIYYQGFKAFKTGYASAIAVILFLIMLVLTMLQWVARKKVSHYEE